MPNANSKLATWLGKRFQRLAHNFGPAAQLWPLLSRIMSGYNFSCKFFFLPRSWLSGAWPRTRPKQVIDTIRFEPSLSPSSLPKVDYLPSPTVVELLFFLFYSFFPFLFLFFCFSFSFLFFLFVFPFPFCFFLLFFVFSFLFFSFCFSFFLLFFFFPFFFFFFLFSFCLCSFFFVFFFFSFPYVFLFFIKKYHFVDFFTFDCFTGERINVATDPTHCGTLKPPSIRTSGKHVHRSSSHRQEKQRMPLISSGTSYGRRFDSLVQSTPST